MRRIYLSPPHMGDDERALLLDAFDSNWIAPLGPHVDAFEREVAGRIGVGHAAALSSGTAALHLALRILGVSSGDEVIVSDLTFAATVNPVVYQGAVPVLVDSERSTWNMDPNLLEDELREASGRGRPPKAVIVTDLYGQCADYDAIVPLCARYGVPLVEDAAEALGATWRGRAAGTFGLMSVLSFNGNKIITTSGGGMLLSDRGELIARARYLATQARDPAPHYEHSEVGYNYRLSNLLAAVGRGQLRVLDRHMAARRANALGYRQALADVPGITFMPHDQRGEPNAWLTVAQIEPSVFGCTPDAVRRHLAAQDIESRPVWKPMHMQPVFRTLRRRGGEVAEELFAHGLCLPSGSSLDDADRARVVTALRSAANGHLA